MNILAEEQKKLYEKGITEHEYQIRERKFLNLYYQLREKTESSFLSRLSLQARMRLHGLILSFYKIKNRLGGYSFEIISDMRIQTNRPIIFAVTHVGKFDIEIISEAIKTHYYLLTGDYEHIQGTIDELFLNMNGAFYFNESVLEDRKTVVKKMIRHLRCGGNLMYFPEGTWNLSPNLPVLPCYWGIVEVALKGNAIIVPVAAEQYDKHFVINIGGNLDLSQYDRSKAADVEYLRDILASLKWEIWESRPLGKRRLLSGSEWDEYVAARFSEWPYFNTEYIHRLTFHPKSITEPAKAFEHLKYLIPSAKNAFLFRKRTLHDETL